MQLPLTNPKAPVNSEGQKPSTEGTPENNPPSLENIPVHTSTPWPKAGKVSGNPSELRKDWPIPKAPVNSEGQKPSTEGTPKNNPPSLENIPVHTSTPWPKAGKVSGNPSDLRKDWLIPPTNNTITTTNSKLSHKE